MYNVKNNNCRKINVKWSMGFMFPIRTTKVLVWGHQLFYCIILAFRLELNNMTKIVF